MAVVLGAVEALEAEVACPLLAHPGMGAQAVGPVDDRPAAERRARLDRDLPVGGRERARVAGRGAGSAGQLELVEVRLVVVAAHLEHADLLARRGQLAGDHAAAGAGADHADVGLDHLLGGGRAADPKRLRDCRAEPSAGPGSRSRPSSGCGPCPRSGRRVVKARRQAAERADPRERRPGPESANAWTIASPGLLRRRRRPCPSRQASRAARRSPSICSVGRARLRAARSRSPREPRGARRRAPRTRRVALAVRRLERRDDRVAEDRQRLPLRVGEEVARRQRAEGLADRLR